MGILYIFGIAILLLGGTESFIEDVKTDNLQQRILLRKLQNFQETKPTAWNEVLADVLVNKIRIFSFSSQDKDGAIKDDALVPKERTILTDFFSSVFVVYKKFIYDGFFGKHKSNGNELVITSLDPKSTEVEMSEMDQEELILPTEVTYAEGPKSEVEIIEPKYHGKITLDEITENPGNDITNNSITDPTTEMPEPESKSNPNIDVESRQNPDTQGNVDPGLQDSIVNCAEGFMKSESGNCVKNVSRMILAIPNQCPIGYRKDWFGYCRKVLRF